MIAERPVEARDVVRFPAVRRLKGTVLSTCDAQILDCRQYRRASGLRRMKPIGNVNTISIILAQFFF